MLKSKQGIDIDEYRTLLFKVIFESNLGIDTLETTDCIEKIEAELIIKRWLNGINIK